ncbi:MAG TPA: dihydropteroate synthase [Bacteroidota bacterium]|nr:dihydropteroate synthase [Bacteroidota bacterium]
MELRLGPNIFDCSERTIVMGILNVTPDSFSDGGQYDSLERAVDHALRMQDDGADIIDIGGESTRPRGAYGQGAIEVPAEEEAKRIIPVIRQLKKERACLISVDTYKSTVAQEALDAGADIINDISGMTFDSRMASVVARYDAAIVLMHIRGTPATMQQHPSYENVVEEVKNELRERIDRAHAAGIKTVIVDPGFGFGKNYTHNLLLLKHLSALKDLQHPLLVGTSRKGFIGTATGAPIDDRVDGTGATMAIAIMNGANLIRVHDVRQMKRVAMMTDAILHAS